MLGRFLDYDTGLSQFVIDVINLGLSFVMISLLFAMIYKVMPNTPLYWRDVIRGRDGHRPAVRAGRP